MAHIDKTRKKYYAYCKRLQRTFAEPRNQETAVMVNSNTLKDIAEKLNVSVSTVN